MIFQGGRTPVPPLDPCMDSIYPYKDQLIIAEGLLFSDGASGIRKPTSSGIGKFAQNPSVCHRGDRADHKLCTS